MIVEHLHQVVHIEELLGSLTGESLFDALVIQVGLQPHGKRRDERLLGHIGNLLRETQMSSRATKCVLGMVFGDTAVGRQLQGNVENLLIKEGDAQLKRVRHRHAVGLQADVVRHVRNHVNVLG